jgi:hypothetical protein
MSEQIPFYVECGRRAFTAPVLPLLLPALKKHNADDARGCYCPKNLAYWVSPPLIAYTLGFRKESGGTTKHKCQRKTIFD